MADSDRGTTLVEVLVVLSIMALLAVPLLAILRSSARIEQTQAGRIDVRSELDRALTLIADDIRTSTPTAGIGGGPKMADSLPLSVTKADGSGLLLIWHVGDAGLERVVFDPAGRREVDRSVVAPEVVPDKKAASFVYFGANGKELDPNVVRPEIVANCTALIAVTLEARAGDRMITSSIDVALRSRPPGGNGC